MGNRHMEDRAVFFILRDFKLEPWMDKAVCKGKTDIMFPELPYPDAPDLIAPAKAICAKCPVREECLEYALDNQEQFGVWGGYGVKERRKIAKAQGRKIPYWGRPRPLEVAEASCDNRSE